MKCPNCGSEVDCSKKNKYCINGIPKTFATKNMLTTYNKLIGNKKRSENDFLAYKKRLNEITSMNIGDFQIIELARGDGEGGADTRDVFNWSICRGLIRKNQKKREIKQKGELDYYEVFERIDNIPCEFLKVKNKKPFCSMNVSNFLNKEELNNGYR